MWKETGEPLVFLLGPKPLCDEVKNLYEQSPSKKLAIQFRQFPLSTKFSNSVKANTPVKVSKGRGLLNISWLKRYKKYIPSVVIVIFDYDNAEIISSHQPWSSYEQNMYERYKELQMETSLYGTALFSLFFVNQRFINMVNIEEVYIHLKRFLLVDKKYFYISFQGLAGLKSKHKSFCGLIEEESQTFYHEKRDKLRIKLNLREKMPTAHIPPLKFQTKLGVFYEIVHNRPKAHEYFKKAYGALTMSILLLLKTFSIWEIKEVADALADKIALYYLDNCDVRTANSLFSEHYTHFKYPLSELDKRLWFREYFWRSAQLKRHAQYLEENIRPNDQSLPQISMYFGFFNFACAKLKVQLRKTIEIYNKPSTIDLNENNNYKFVDSIYLGKEKSCLEKATNNSVSPEKSADLTNNLRIVKYYSTDFSNEIISMIKNTLTTKVNRTMKSYLEYYLLKEYQRMNKRHEYLALKRKLVDGLNASKWALLSGRILLEHHDFVMSKFEEDPDLTSMELFMDSIAYGYSPVDEDEVIQRNIQFKNEVMQQFN